MFDVIALGEFLIDFTSRGKSENDSFMYEANPGGAPCNVLAALSVLGNKTAFAGKVGKDTFGMFLQKTAENLGIDCSHLYRTDKAFTTLAFVTLDELGNREFAFSRNGSADTLLNENEIDEDFIKSARVFHCGTLSLTDEPSKSATKKALKIAKENGVCISVDPNLREMLWKSKNQAIEAIKEVITFADIIKISDYEAEYLYGTSDVDFAAERIFKEYKPKILFITSGKDGAYLFKDDKKYFHPCFDVKTIDTTGAGDAFTGSVLSVLLEYGLDFDALSEENLKYILHFASAAASLATTKHGAIFAMPDRVEIKTLL